jgi:predicted O-methyltransferase YrrM
VIQPKDFDRYFEETLAAIEAVDGWLSSSEVKLLTMLAAYPAAEGGVLEIGTFNGRSTIVLARAAKWAADGPITAVDPLPDCLPRRAGEQRTPRQILEDNLRHAGVEDYVQFHRMPSAALSQRWNRLLRLLWIDGDHRYESVLSDISKFSPFLADGAFVVFHDVINVQYLDVSRVFIEEVLQSPHFGASGICDSIGWAQYHKNPDHARAQHRANQRFARTLASCTGWMNPDEWPPHGWAKFRFRRLWKRLPKQWPDLARPARLAA